MCAAPARGVARSGVSATTAGVPAAGAGAADEARAVRLIQRHEGLRLLPYRDTVGKWTIGYGRNLSDRGITRAEAECLLRNDLRDVTAGLDRVLPWWRGLDMVRRAVLVDMGFNLGVAGLARFTNTLAAVRAGEWEAAAAGMMRSKWARQVGARAVRLATMMRTGEWPVEVA